LTQEYLWQHDNAHKDSKGILNLFDSEYLWHDQQGDVAVLGKCGNCEINAAADNDREDDHLPQVRRSSALHSGGQGRTGHAGLLTIIQV